MSAPNDTRVPLDDTSMYANTFSYLGLPFSRDMADGDIDARINEAIEPFANLVSGVVFALSGVFGVLLLEIPRFRAALLAVAGA